MQNDEHYNTVFLKNKTGPTLCDWEGVQPSRLTVWGITSPLAACRKGKILCLRRWVVHDSALLDPRTITWCKVPGVSSLASLGIPLLLFAPNP